VVSQEALSIIDNITTIDSKVGVYVIDDDHKIQYANKAFLKLVNRAKKDVEGQQCYIVLNKFQNACSWCPAIKAMDDGQVHQALQRWQKKQNITHASVISLPIKKASKIINESVNMVLDKHSTKTNQLTQRINRYESIKQIGTLLQSISSSDYISDFLLLGTVWEKCLDFSFARIYAFTWGDDDIARIDEVRELFKSLSFDSFANKLNLPLRREEISPLRSKLWASYIKKAKFQNRKPSRRPLLQDTIKTTYGSEIDCCFKSLHEKKLAFRLDGKTVATLVTGSLNQAYLLVASISGTGNDIVTDRRMLDLGILGGVSDRALGNHRLSEEVSQIKDKTNALFSKLKEDEQALLFSSSIVSSYAHDLKPLCSSILSDYSSIWSQVSTNNQRDLLSCHQNIKNKMIFIRGCLDRAIDIARMRHIDIERFPISDMNETIQDSVDVFRNILTSINTAVSLNLTPESKFNFDVTLIKQVIQNLIGNSCWALEAVKYRRRELKIETERQSEHFIIYVEDNGCGISDSILDDIWEPFISTKGRGLGTGLGLMICRKIISIHEGSIEVVSKFGYGAKFTIKIPL